MTILQDGDHDSLHTDGKILRSRKEDHVNLTLKEDVQVADVSNGFEFFDFVPTAVPSINFNNISLETEFLGRKFSAPILIAGMTGGYPKAEDINKGLAALCSKLNIPMGVGSQRAMIENPASEITYNVKSEVPDVYLIGNLGLVQFSLDYDVNHYKQAQESINADAMAIHVNAFQELCQPEGDLNWTGSWDNLAKICKASNVPVIGKEVGGGIAWEEVEKMSKLGCSAIDLGGAGGTSWAKIELMRNDNEDALSINDPTLKWGISTALATWEATEKVKTPLISTGGMYHGLMAAKALAMGSSMVGFARPVLQALVDGGQQKAERWINQYLLNLKRVMFLLGVDNVEDLKKQKRRLIPKGAAKDWLERRGF